MARWRRSLVGAWSHASRIFANHSCSTTASGVVNAVGNTGNAIAKVHSVALSAEFPREGNLVHWIDLGYRLVGRVLPSWIHVSVPTDPSEADRDAIALSVGFEETNERADQLVLDLVGDDRGGALVDRCVVFLEEAGAAPKPGRCACASRRGRGSA